LALTDTDVRPQQLSKVLDEMAAQLSAFRTLDFIRRQQEKFDEMSSGRTFSSPIRREQRQW
jgi:hypothetical protein